MRELLNDSWTELAQMPEALLLRWVVAPDAGRMVHLALWLERGGPAERGAAAGRPPGVLRLRRTGEAYSEGGAGRGGSVCPRA